MYALGLIGRMAFALLAAVACQSALAQSGHSIRNFRIDVAPLRVNVGDPTASWVQQELPHQLEQALAGRVTARAAPRGGESRSTRRQANDHFQFVTGL
jgi:hypothetical protein